MSNLVFYNGETYDITDFISKHPGGSIIKNAIGKNLEEVWEKYGVNWHLNNSRVMDTLKKYKVNSGNSNNFSIVNSKNLDIQPKKYLNVVYDLFILLPLVYFFVNIR